MSLHALASHMATKGRGGDSMLVHMTPGEVAGLQALAVKHGGELTINPDTGLPEANFLKKMLPMIAGLALAPLTAGTSLAFLAATPLATAMTVGGITGLATGSLSRGLMAGLGAYGGASLGAGLAGAGAGAAQDAAMAGLTGEQIAQQAAAQGLTEQGVLNQAAAEATKNFAASGAGSQLAQGATAAFNNPSSFVQGMGGTAKTLGAGYAAAMPMMAADTVQTTTKRPDTGTIRNFTFDPYGQTYSDAGSYPASEYRGMAQGGIVALAAGGTPRSVEDLYRDYAGRGSDPGGLQYWQQQFGDTIDDTEAGTFQSAVAAARAQGTELGDVNQAQANTMVQDMYRNVLNRDAEQSGLNYWSDMIQSSNDPNRIYKDFLASAQAGSEIGNFGLGFEQATTPFQGYKSADTGSNADEWVRNVLGREVTAADRNQQWYKDMGGVTTAQEAKDAYNDFLRSTGAKTDLNWMAASQLNPLARPVTTPQTYAPEGTSNPYGNPTNPGDQTFNRDGSITVQPNIPGRPYGGFSGMGQVRDAYTQGGGSLGYVNPAPKTMEEFDQRFNRQTGDSLAAYNYLMGKGANPIKSGVGEIMRPYSEAVRGVPAAEGRPTQRYIYQDGRYVENPNYRPLSYNSKGERMIGMTSTEVIKGLQGLKDPADDGALFDFVTDNRISEAQLAAALGISIAEARARIAAGKKQRGPLSTITNLFDGGGGDGASGAAAGSSGSGDAAGDAAAAAADGAAAAAGDGAGPGTGAGWAYGGQVRRMALGGLGGLGALAGGGATSQYNLGGYSDGGRLLRGPGDGVSDSIPATIGDKQPARLADGEFVVPARIVSELGNGSTEAGARKLYAMMDRVQKARGKTTGKNRVAANTRSEKYLPA